MILTGHVDVARAILERGADVNAVVGAESDKRHGETALHTHIRWCDTRSVPMVDLLLTTGVQYDAQDRSRPAAPSRSEPCHRPIGMRDRHARSC